jgi:alanyl-tRNA synthetase
LDLQGGGKPDSAMGSGNNVDQVQEAVKKVLAFYKTKVEGA